jgi:hypothetical protein
MISTRYRPTGSSLEEAPTYEGSKTAAGVGVFIETVGWKRKFDACRSAFASGKVDVRPPVASEAIQKQPQGELYVSDVSLKFAHFLPSFALSRELC